ncbi:hypothetical protein ACQP2F_38480 [Actinoplanes sp. CA-030573]|uniref:hypothetical protein n=1 Tax=Actinoplanes sp. CA-030573 TaxID=3239898 RepID=UPI003D8EECF9
MNNPALPFAVAAVVLVIVLTEIIAAALPLLIVITLVPAHERQELAGLLAACDSSRKLRFWTALDVAVKARRLRAGKVTPTVTRAEQAAATPDDGGTKPPAASHDSNWEWAADADRGPWNSRPYQPAAREAPRR